MKYLNLQLICFINFSQYITNLGNKLYPSPNFKFTIVKNSFYYKYMSAGKAATRTPNNGPEQTELNNVPGIFELEKIDNGD